ncbi:MAG: bifunctional oligoribonuclease/PAP phosphatase NrnA [Erysipelothrix sp.]|nr:bifunctional oligoribonuclease/PAP phosphatase NrnA [Erysipelothrix sp.]
MNKLLETIKNEDIIALFRHVNPDGDALGSQYGIAQYIKDNYPEKTVFIMGKRNDELDFFPHDETEVSDEALKDAYAIVLDSATKVRIDGAYIHTKGLLNIDHHPTEQPYGDQYVVDPKRSSTCEIVAELLLEGDIVSEVCAAYLLSGILSDTVRFSIENTLPDTLRVAANLMEKGANISKLSRIFFNKKYEKFNYERIFAKDVEFEDGLASLIISNEKRQELNLSDREAKEYASVMYDVKEFQINVIFVESDDGGYIGSLRSKEITVNDIAAKYHGGGHRLAAGFKACDKFEVNDMKKELLARIKESK